MKGDFYDIRREFVGANRQTNRVIPSLPQQAPPVARAHLMSVVRKVERRERSKGKPLRGSVFKGLHKSQGKNITSLLPSRQKSEGISQQYSVIRDNAERSNSEMNQLVHASQYANDKYTLKSSKARKEKEEVKFKRPGSMNDDDIESDVIKLDSDVTIRDIEVNKPIARKRYAQKHLIVSKKGFLKSLLRVYSRTFTKVALMLAIVIIILGGLFNIKLPERKSTIGTSSSLSTSKPCVVLRCHGYSTLSILRGSAAAIIGISEGLCSCIRKVIFSNGNQQLTRCMKVLQNTIIRGVTICTNCSPSSMLKTCAPYYCPDYATHSPTTFAKNILAGKHLDAYIFPSTDFCASRVDYLDIYTVNLESDVNFTVFYDLIYLYIYIYIYIYFLLFVVVL